MGKRQSSEILSYKSLKFPEILINSHIQLIGILPLEIFSFHALHLVFTLTSSLENAILSDYAQGYTINFGWLITTPFL